MDSYRGLAVGVWISRRISGTAVGVWRIEDVSRRGRSRGLADEGRNGGAPTGLVCPVGAPFLLISAAAATPHFDPALST